MAWVVVSLFAAAASPASPASAGTRPALAWQGSQEGAVAAGPLDREEARRLSNPIPYDEASVARGRSLYLRHCPECHDRDGRALANTTYEAADLTDPSRWLYGTSDGELFRSIRDGAGDDMPPYRDILKRSDDVWHLVNFLRSLGPGEWRPAEVENPGRRP